MFGSGFKGFFGGGGMGGMGGMPEQKETKQINTTEYYELLEITKTASSEQVRKAFRRKALKAHPDKGGDPEKFKQISNAYEVLNNPEKRDLYDKYGPEGVQNGGPGGAGGFEDLFSFFSGGRGQRDTGPKKAKPKLVKLQVTLQEIYLGVTKKVSHKRSRVCEKCDGKGGDNVKKCPKCQGKKFVQKLVQLGPGMYTQSRAACGDCKGEGQIFDQKTRCKQCKGNKTIQKQKIIDVAIEVGCPDEHDYIFTGESDEYPGIMAGDLYVRVLIKDHKTYERRGADLFITQKISLLNALTGVTFELTQLDGKKFVVSTAPGEVISHKQRKTVKGVGMPFYKDTMSHGNLYIDFEVEFPKKNTINTEKAKILQQVLNATPKMQEEVPSNKKKGKKQTVFLEDFNEKDLNKNPKGKTNSRQAYYDEDDEPERGGGGRTQCQQQ